MSSLLDLDIEPKNLINKIKELEQRIELLEKFALTDPIKLQAFGNFLTAFPELITVDGLNVGIYAEYPPLERLVVDRGNLVVQNTTVTGAIVQIQSKQPAPADADVAGTLRAYARNDANEDTIAVDVYFTMEDVSDGNERGGVYFDVQEGGADAFPLTLKGNKAGFNDQNPAEAVDVTGNVNLTGVLKVDDVQVVGNRVVDARCDDAINSGDATTDGVIDALRDAMIAHGLIAAA